MIVNLTESSSSRTHATFPKEDNEAVNSMDVVSCFYDAVDAGLTRESLDIPY